MKNFETLKDIKKMAITITNAVQVRYPQFNKTEVLTIDFSKLVDRTYNVNNGTIAFVSDGKLYVIPYMKPVMDILLENNFIQNYMYVPFSNWDYPVLQSIRWNDLKRTAKECVECA